MRRISKRLLLFFFSVFIGSMHAAEIGVEGKRNFELKNNTNRTIYFSFSYKKDGRKGASLPDYPGFRKPLVLDKTRDSLTGEMEGKKRSELLNDFAELKKGKTTYRPLSLDSPQILFIALHKDSGPFCNAYRFTPNKTLFLKVEHGFVLKPQVGIKKKGKRFSQSGRSLENNVTKKDIELVHRGADWKPNFDVVNGTNATLLVSATTIMDRKFKRGFVKKLSPGTHAMYRFDDIYASPELFVCTKGNVVSGVLYKFESSKRVKKIYVALSDFGETLIPQKGRGILGKTERGYSVEGNVKHKDIKKYTGTPGWIIRVFKEYYRQS